MKLVKTASGKQTLKISKSEWQNIGKKAGWMKTKKIITKKASLTTDIDHPDIMSDLSPDEKQLIKEHLTGLYEQLIETRKDIRFAEKEWARTEPLDIDEYYEEFGEHGESGNNDTFHIHRNRLNTLIEKANAIESDIEHVHKAIANEDYYYLQNRIIGFN